MKITLYSQSGTVIKEYNDIDDFGECSDQAISFLYYGKEITTNCIYICTGDGV